MMKNFLNNIEEVHILTPNEFLSWWVPPDEKWPMPHTHEIMLFIAYMICWLGFPTEDLLKSLLEDSDINFVNLAPNSNLMMSVFIPL